jgi:hydrogenase expression/formation protein HypD
LAEKYHVPFVVTGFEPLDLLKGIYLCLKQLEEQRFDVENAYARSVRHDGNRHAQEILRQVFRIATRKWRGIGPIENSGYELSDAYTALDAQNKFGLTKYSVEENTDCISGLVLQGLKKPDECPLFARSCTPEHPFGATMVSSEGACAAYYLYRGRT